MTRSIVIAALAFAACKKESTEPSEDFLATLSPAKIEDFDVKALPGKKLELTFRLIGRDGAPMHSRQTYGYKVLGCSGGSTMRDENYDVAKRELAKVTIDLQHCGRPGPDGRVKVEFTFDSYQKGKTLTASKEVDATASLALTDAERVQNDADRTAANERRGKLRAVMKQLGELAAIVPDPDKPAVASKICPDREIEARLGTTRWVTTLDHEMLASAFIDVDAKPPAGQLWTWEPFLFTSSESIQALAGFRIGRTKLGGMIDEAAIAKGVESLTPIVKIYRARLRTRPSAHSDNKFTSGAFDGIVVFVDRDTKQVLCQSAFTAQNSATVKVVRGDSKPLEADFARQFHNASVEAVKSMSQWLERE